MIVCFSICWIRGCLSQITASSYVGTFGHKVEIFSRQLIENGQAYILASDVHDLPGRKYEIREAFDRLQHEFENNAKSIIGGEAVRMHQLQAIREKRGKWFGLF
ncbi:CpsB/CapC family capsule biosynthesis tyrosine phosphatase [Levilactobacillus brevis]|uniref:CpsB/CapC family capsule biosynthesis tyrosine phosphatase n=1 Tax=Levilactobacillus brevis TaxID=1580 RepID=UPI0031FE86A3